MANLKSAIKRTNINEKKAMANSRIKSETKTIIKKFELAIENKDKKLAEELYKEAIKKVDMAYSKGIYKRNTVARKKSYLTKQLNSLINKK